MNKKIKNIIAKVLIGASMAVTVAGAGLMSSGVQASASTGDYDSKYTEDHNKIQVQSWYYDNGCNFKFKYEREDTAYIKLGCATWYSYMDVKVNLSEKFPNVIYNGAKSQTTDDMTLTRDYDGFLVLKVPCAPSGPYSNSVTAKFYADDGNNYCYRNTNNSPSLYEGSGFIVQSKFVNK